MTSGSGASAFIGDYMGLYGLGPQRCPVCSATTGLRRCGGCRVVTYCSTDHQTTHRPTHRAACTAIKNTHAKLDQEEAALRAHPGDAFTPADVFNTRVGRFWGILGTRDYMRARFAAANALLKINSVLAVEKALGHFTDMLRLCRSDNLGIRDIVPDLLLRLGREQECYDFLKWWTTPDADYDWGDTSLPYLDTRNADPFESVAGFTDRAFESSLAHLATLTLLKARLHRDLEAHKPVSDIDLILGISDAVEPDWPAGDLARSILDTLDMDHISRLIQALEQQIKVLCRAVHKANPHFWDLLVSEETVDPPVDPYSVGSAEHASLVVSCCRRAWEESEDVIPMINDMTCSLLHEYRGPLNTATGSGGGDNRAQKLEVRRGTGALFPWRFQPPVPVCTPAEIFPATAFGRNYTLRFGALDSRREILIYTDGACPDNGQPGARAGWAVVCGDKPESGRLEDKGPFGDNSVPTSNRAELRASIAALRLSDWRGEGFNSIVIATDSSYVVDGITGWVKGWIRNGWTTRTGGEVKNRDLWELLLGEVERWHDLGLRITFWRIPREQNIMADEAAKDAATWPAEPEFKDVCIDASDAVIPLTPIAPITTTPAAATSASATTPRILTLCFDYEKLFDDLYKPLISKLTSKAKMDRATTAADALAALDREPSPSIILVADAGLARHRAVWERVIDRVRAGATVVLAGCFSSMISPPDFTRFFARAGLQWKRSEYQRSTTALRRNAVGSRLAARLPAAYSQKAVFVGGVDPSAWWYAADDATGAAVVFAAVGEGKLGYVGDVNGEDGSEAVVLAMCGLLE